MEMISYILVNNRSELDKALLTDVSVILCRFNILAGYGLNKLLIVQTEKELKKYLLANQKRIVVPDMSKKWLSIFLKIKKDILGTIDNKEHEDKKEKINTITKTLDANLRSDIDFAIKMQMQIREERIDMIKKLNDAFHQLDVEKVDKQIQTKWLDLIFEQYTKSLDISDKLLQQYIYVLSQKLK